MILKISGNIYLCKYGRISEMYVKYFQSYNTLLFHSCRSEDLVVDNASIIPA